VEMKSGDASAAQPPTFIRGILGGFSNSIAVTILSPLDVLKIRFQTQGELTVLKEKEYKSVLRGAAFVIKNEGITGLWKGITVSIAREMLFTSTRFALYEPVREIFTNKNNKEFTLISKILSGLVCGAFAAALFNPTDVLKIRFQADIHGTRYTGVFNAIGTVIKTEGVIQGLYKGVGTTTLRAALLTSAQLASYDHSKHTLIRKYKFQDNLSTHFCASMFSGFITSLVTNPIDVVRTRIMNEKVAAGQQRIYTNPFISIWKIFESEGVLGLYKGFVPSYIRLGGCTVIGFILYEQMRIILGYHTI